MIASGFDGRATVTGLHFAQHHQYPLRESWIVRGLQALAETERQGTAAQLFAHPAATDRFGMGPAMVQALRFWLRAAGVMMDRPGPGVRHIPTLTPLGRLLQQADPYLERTGSVWLLHAQLVRSRAHAPAFSWFFQHFASAIPFTKQECVESCHTWAIKEAPTQEMSSASVRKDIECLLRMYLPSPLLSPEQQGVASPFQRLGLLTALQLPLRRERGAAAQPVLYGFHPSRDVPALVVLAVLLEQAGTRLPLHDLLFAPGQIGRTFGLTQSALFEVFHTIRSFAPAWCPSVARFVRQEWVTVPDVPAAQVLADYYGRQSGRFREQF